MQLCRMKKWIVAIAVLFARFSSGAQVLIHAHNDYQQPLPFTNAIENSVFSLEADVYLVDSILMVAHDKKDIKPSATLYQLYLLPFIERYRQYHGFATADKQYKPVLVIDIKENSAAVIQQLIVLLEKNKTVFDRSLNPAAVQVVLSGDRGPINKWNSYPSFIFFDGRPYENYDSAALQRVAFISDTYFNYFNRQDSTNTSKLESLVKKVHAMNKLLRVWAMPDEPASWQLQRRLGIDIINTNKVSECRNYFPKKE